ncbi:MAG TPA: prepilin-type N-terminal cleavage/methylation domain-containing protein [Terriglobales bacterium]|nr:prepilin-type N-terminal cleavage/methylation domain-containing protein [Terriglobales bacterium]
MAEVSKTRERGFTLIEMMIALALGVLVVGAAVDLFSRGMNASWLVSQRAEMQQDVRAASNFMRQDISMAGAGLPVGGVALPAGSGTPIYGCDQNKCYIGNTASPAGIAFPNNFIYGVIPGYQLGTTINAAKGPTDIITVAYVDYSLLSNCYNVTFNNSNGTQATFSLPGTPLPGCSAPPPPVLSNSANGLTAGDLLLFTSNVGGNTAYAVGEVTQNVTGSAAPYTVNLVSPDALGINQPGATSGDTKQIVAGTGTTAVRLLLISYYINVLPDPLGAGAGVPRLMRQVSGHTPVPLAENIADMHFTYDTYDTSGNLLNNTGDGGLSVGVSPGLIRNVNITHLTIRGQLRGTTGYQGFDLQTAVSTRNMAFQNRYQ